MKVIRDAQALQAYVFDRQVAGDTKWFNEPDFEDAMLPAESWVEYCRDLFLLLPSFHHRYSNAQLALGLDYLVNWACGSLAAYAFFEPSVPESKRLDALESMFSVFRVLDARCAHSLSSDSIDGPSPEPSLNGCCYMWWDVLPHHGNPAGGRYSQTNRVMLETMERVLQLDNVACKESALHGLGHWQGQQDEAVGRIIVSAFDQLPESLRAYAHAAIRGYVL